MNKERIVEKVKKVLALANNNPNEAEAQVALLTAQELIVKYNIEMKEVCEEEIKAFELILKDTKGVNASWKKYLLQIIAKNFRCEVIFQTYHKSSVHHAGFLGLQEDVEVAATIYLYAVNVIEKGMYRCYRRFRDSGKNAQGVRGDYALGFLNGLNDKYQEQVQKNNWGLVLTIHPIVQEKLKEFTKMKEDKSQFKCQGNDLAISMGYKDGKEFAEPHTQIEGSNS